MRHFFSFSLKGRDVAGYVLGIYFLMLLVGGTSAWYDYVYGDMFADSVLMNWSWLRNGALSLVAAFVVILLYSLLNLGLIRKTVCALGLKEEKFVAEYDTRKYLLLILKGVLLTVITFGIYAPWFKVKLLRFYSDGISHRYNYLSFRGNAITLFGIVVLFLILPYVAILTILAVCGITAFTSVDAMSLVSLWVVLGVAVALLLESIFICLYYRWLIEFSYGSKRITTKFPSWSGIWFILGQMVLTIITFGLYAPMMWLRTLRFFLSRTVVGDVTVESRMGMSLVPWRDWAYIWGQLLLTAITAGIYMPWAYARISTRFFPRCFVEDVASVDEPMPAEG